MSKVKNSKIVKQKKKVKLYDDKLSQELADIIEPLTHSGNKVLNKEDYKKVEHICNRSDKYVKETYNLVIECLDEKHAEVRLSTFQLCNELFRTSHCFREQVINDLEKIVELTTGKTLPPPSSVARELKRSALKAIHEWNENFGDRYIKLAIGYNYLCKVEKIDFNALEVEDSAAQARQQENGRRYEAINQERLKKVIAEIKDKEADIKSTATGLSSCINLLLPHPDDFFIADNDTDVDKPCESVLPASAQYVHNDSDGSDDESQDAGLREVGMVNYTHSIQVDFTPSSEVCIVETLENAAIIESSKEYAKLIGNKYLPTVKAWLELLSKSSEQQEERHRINELRGELEDTIFKYERITFRNADDVSSDSELEEVPIPQEKRSIEPTVIRNSTLWTIYSKEDAEGDLTAAQPPPVSPKEEPLIEPGPSTSTKSMPASSSDRKQKLLSIAPKLPFDVDLYHWEDEKLPVPTIMPSNIEGHRFWMGSDSHMDELPVPEGSASLRTRVIEFTGQFSPVTHSCKVRLPSGKLCPRRDRLKCPFHGEIVPRDDAGNCINIQDAMRLQALAEKRQQEKPDWQDPKLLAEIKKTKGIDLKMPEKGKRKKRKKEYPGLTDLKEIDNTATKRLEKKIFKKSAIRKVASAMDRMDQRKFNDKFGDQFQYFYNA